MDVWAEQESLARDVGRWGIASVVLGCLLATLGHRTGDMRLRAFGAQNAGWGAVDLGIVAVVRRIAVREFAALDEPRGAVAQRARRRTLLRLLLLNTGLDAGYVWFGARLYRRRAVGSSARGHAAAIVLQGAFLFTADSLHAARLLASECPRPLRADPLFSAAERLSRAGAA